MKHDRKMITLESKPAASFHAEISEEVWDKKYRLYDIDGTPIDMTVEDSWRRIARALAEAEPEELRPVYEEEFYQALQDWKYLPAGRITAGAGTGRDVTLFNCFVMGTIPDSMAGIFEMLKQAALTMQQGGGIGYDFSTIRPMGEIVQGVGSDASGPLSFMDVWDSMCRTIMSAGSRRGAMMGTMRCDHPDIEAFIAAKADPARLRMFNLSVLVTDALMEAVKEDADWHLTWNGETRKVLKARDLWNQIMEATYAQAEPGVIFIDRINDLNPLRYCEEIRATNPCGEQPLPPYGACLLGSINLAALISNPFEENAELDLDRMRMLVASAVRMMDNVVSVSRFPLDEQDQEAQAKRRIGLGVTGLADALAMLRLTYGEPEAVAQTEEWMREIQHTAYWASVYLAKEKGPFPLFDAEKYCASPTIQKLDHDLQDAIRKYGIRNALLTSIAPTGTISLYAGNVSSGIEPIFDTEYTRKKLERDGSHSFHKVMDYAVKVYREKYGDSGDLPDYFATAQTLSPMDHVRMQAAAQKWVDSSISKTINCPKDISFEDFKDIYMAAYESGCKGCTTYRPNEITGSVLSVDTPESKEGNVAEEGKQATENSPPPSMPNDFGTDLMDRPEVLVGRTYKLKWPESSAAFYIVINDLVDEKGRHAPFEMFINTQNVEAQAWMAALTRMISAVFRRGGDVSFVAEELKAVFDPRGGAWMKGRYIPSLIAAIGNTVERHMIETGFIPGDMKIAPAMPAGATIEPTEASAKAEEVEGAPARPLGRLCSSCGDLAVIKEAGCDKCTSCGNSSCS